MKFTPPTRPAFRGANAFSLVEVVVALGICAFVLVGIMGLFMTGMQANHESEGEIQAANLASLIISSCRAAPLSGNANAAIPPMALTNSFAAIDQGKYVALDGTLTSVASDAAYGITCRCGTTPLTGSNAAQVYLMLNWPVQENANSGGSHYYEVSTYIPLR